MIPPTHPKVLMIGPVPPDNPSPTNPVGGTSIHFQETIRELSARAVHLDVIDTTRQRVNMNRLMFAFHGSTKLCKIVATMLKRARSCDVVFLNLTAGRISFIGPLLWTLCSLFRRPMILRLFGGEFADTYDRYTRLVRWLADHTFMRSARIYVQTRAISNRFADRPNVHWFPNTRDVRTPRSRIPVSARRFLFVAQLRTEKGLRETLEACRSLPDGCHLSVYGPYIGGFDMGLIVGHNHASYEGLLFPKDVPDVIADHDVVVLPTYFASEGYPGVIIEAFQCGRPVISTWWKSIPEVVQHGQNGLLVTPRSTAELGAAIFRLVDDSNLYSTLRLGARRRGECFRSAPWYDRLAKDIGSLVDVPRHPL